jgi:circadian clock protein KaiC
MMRSDSDKRLSSGVPGLDSMIGGGFLPQDSTLFAGSPGTGKTTFGLHFIAAGAQAGEPGIFVTFEYLPQQIYRDAMKRGWDLKKWEKEGLLRLVCTTPDVLLAEVGDGKTILDELIKELGAKRLVIDSMTHFQYLAKADHTLRDDIVGLMNHLRLLDVTTVITHEVPEIIGPAVRISDFGLEFLVDNVIILRYVELESRMEKAINVLKFRGGDHDRAYRSFRQTGKGIIVENPFTDVENISGGSARRSQVADRAKQLI